MGDTAWLKLRKCSRRTIRFWKLNIFYALSGIPPISGADFPEQRVAESMRKVRVKFQLFRRGIANFIMSRHRVRLRSVATGDGASRLQSRLLRNPIA